MKKILMDFSLRELKEEFERIGEKAFHAKQVIKWLALQKPIEEMTDLSIALRGKLRRSYTEGYAETCRVLTAADGTRKYLFRYEDGSTVESVFMQKEYGNTVCISTQVGCRMGCAFCASCKDGWKRNLTAGEILAQVVAVNAAQGEGRNINNIVLMGMGEPFDNYENVVKFIRMVNNSAGMGIGLRGISLSTCGLVEGIERFAEEGLGVTLSISLHAASDEKRIQIMPTAQKYKIHEILSAAKTYFLKTGRRIIIEYAIIDGFNDTKEDVFLLKDILHGMNCHVNLIPLNGNDGLKLKAPDKRKVYAFCAMLEKEGISATVRKSMGGDIAGACGQLRQQYIGENEGKA
ncbi:23S rRNA (adenine(2503)-C(2))-methyltransferase RlmN [Christensenella tenuis]|jgi:23S rRNA (adenine2503-C2)-methyltransferase|uniref:Probable dual-specificity RNA methyltransferase RlmN n=1 Tax=Christensenella tenuis TaxID=2763033 RepID=A0ABR7ED14_9FIRM|nr:23S rRNA (adenine(2503)-C(2))-methyltransferase RlmN [Christensenella tenuis]MBC5647068.1 23S rRNA (adenine(2503)-C(2))-methyltransferase RlmN [Christensenella tenuis]